MKNIIVSFALLLCVTTLNVYANEKTDIAKKQTTPASQLQSISTGWSSDMTALNGIAKGGSSGISNFSLPNNSAIPTVTDNSGSGRFFTNLSVGSAAPAGIDQKTWDAMIKALPGDPSKAVALTPVTAGKDNLAIPDSAHIINLDGTTQNMATSDIDQKTLDALIKALPGDPTKAVALTPTTSTDKNFAVPATVVSTDGAIQSYPVKQMSAYSSGSINTTSQKIVKTING